MKKAFSFLIILIVATTSLLSVFGYFGRVSWFLDLFSHFKWQYLLVISTGTIIIFFKKRKLSFIFLPFIIALLIDIAPLFYGGNKDTSLTETTKIASINLLSSNGQFDDVANFVKKNNPDILILQEFTTLWQLMLEPKLNDYRYRMTIPRNGNFGIAIYSKVKITELEELDVGEKEFPSIHGNISLNSTKARLIATHPLPPIDNYHFNNRNNQLNEIGDLVTRLDQEAIVIGDLNISSFSIHFKDFITNAGLTDTRRGFGLLTTWPTYFKLASTTIDHCLVTDGISIKSRTVGEDIGSDHLPILVEVGVK